MGVLGRGTSWAAGVYVVIFALLGGAAVWLGADLADGRARIIAERSTLATQKSQFMSQWFGTTIVSADYVLREIIDRVPVDEIEALAGNPARNRRLDNWLGEKLRTIPGVGGLTVYDRDCRFVATADPRLRGFRSNQKSCVDPDPRLDDRTYIQYVPADKSANKRPTILVSRHHLSADGRLLGGALAAIDVGQAQDWISSFEIDRHDVLALVDGDGTLLARNPALPAAIGTRTPSPAGQPSFGEQRSSATFRAVSPLDGRERLYGLSKIENIPLVIIVGYDLADSLREWRRRAWQLSGGFLALSVLAVLAMHAHRVALRQREEMRRLAVTDPLTGVANRRHLVAVGEQEFSRARRYGGGMSLFMIDIDRFKTINDTWGHPTGDRAIQALAGALTATVRAQDMVGRLGGEEFAAILPETDRAGALVMAERLRHAVEAETQILSDEGEDVRFTVSIGIASLAPGDDAFEDVLGRADKALYAAKTNGRNRVEVL